MDAQIELLEAIRRGESPFLAPRALAHSQELKEELPQVRRHIGPRGWYQALENSLPAPTNRG